MNTCEKYYIKDYYTNEIIDTTDNLSNAIAISKSINDSQVTDDNDNVYYTNMDLPFC